MEIFEQMIFYIRSVQRLDNYLKYQNKKLKWIPYFEKLDDEYILNHPIQKNLKQKELKRFSERCEKVTFGVIHNVLWLYDKYEKNYDYDIVTNYIEVLKYRILKTQFTENINEFYNKNEMYIAKYLDNLFRMVQAQLQNKPNYEDLAANIEWLKDCQNHFETLDPKSETLSSIVTEFQTNLNTSYGHLRPSDVEKELNSAQSVITNQDKEIEERMQGGKDTLLYLDTCLNAWEVLIAPLSKKTKKSLKSRKDNLESVKNLILEFNENKLRIQTLTPGSQAQRDEIRYFIQKIELPDERNILSTVRTILVKHYKNMLQAMPMIKPETKPETVEEMES